MKRWILGSLAFLSALVAGWVAVYSVSAWDAYLREANTQSCPEHDEVTEPSRGPSIEESSVFIPEFASLPDWDELDDADHEMLGKKLVDIPDSSIFRRSEVVAKDGEKWLVLTRGSDGDYSLRESKAKVKKLNTTSWPGDEKDAKLSFDFTGKAIIAVRGILGIQSGPVNTAYLDPFYLDAETSETSDEMRKDYRREFLLKGQPHVLRTALGQAKDGTKLAVLVLESDGKQQVLTQAPYEHFHSIGRLLWAGDLDADGKIDLYFDRFNEIGAFSGSLFLSSQAKGNNLVGLSAIFQTSGC